MCSAKVKFSLDFHQNQWKLCSFCNCGRYNRTDWSFQFSEILCSPLFSQIKSCLPIFLALIKTCIKVKMNLLMEEKEIFQIAPSIMNNAYLIRTLFSLVCSCHEVMNRKKNQFHLCCILACGFHSSKSYKNSLISLSFRCCDLWPFRETLFGYYKHGKSPQRNVKCNKSFVKVQTSNLWQNCRKTVRIDQL